MSMESQGDRIRAAREARNMSQGELAVQVGGCRQATISDWECGKSTPSDKYRDKVAEVLSLRKEELRSAPKGPRRVTDADPQSEQVSPLAPVQEYLDDNRDAPMNMWIFGPDMMSLLDGDYIKSHWVKNMLNGVDYNIIWDLDVVDTDLLEEMRILQAPLLEEIPERNEHGRISHFAATSLIRADGTGTPDGNKDPERVEALVHGFINGLGTAGDGTRHSRVELQFARKDKLASIQGYFEPPFRNTLLIVDKARELKPLASTLLNSVDPRNPLLPSDRRNTLAPKGALALSTRIGAFARAARQVSERDHTRVSLDSARPKGTRG